jgi:transposase-like protein
MFSISLEIESPDFSEMTVDFDCPYCKLKTEVTMGAIRRRDYTICRGCHATVLLDDQMASVRKVLDTLDNFVRNISE